METLVARDEFACLLFAAIFLPFFRRKLARYSPSVSIYLGTNQTVFRIVLFPSLDIFTRSLDFFFPLFLFLFFTSIRTFQNPRDSRKMYRYSFQGSSGYKNFDEE